MTPAGTKFAGHSIVVREVSASTGTITTVAGTGIPGFTGDGGPATNANLLHVDSVAIDPSGNIFIADASNQRIREIVAASGIILTVAGNGTNGNSGDGGLATNASLSYPIGVALDASGDLYIADGAANKVRAVGPALLSPTITWIPPLAVTYGTPLSSTQLSATSNIAGTFVYSPALGTVLTAGTQTLSVIFTPTDTTNFATVSVSVPLTVNQATPSISWNPLASISSGTALSAAQLNASSTVAGTFSYLPAAGTVLPAGPQILAATFTPTDTANYTTSGAINFLTVTGGTSTWDAGTVTLTVNGSAISTASYGQGSTPSSVAQALANASSNSLVRVTAIDDDLYIEASPSAVTEYGGSGTNFPFSLSATNANHTAFPTPSFVPSPLSGNLQGGANAQAVSQPTTVYSYNNVGYDGVGNLLSYTDSVTGTWNFSSGYDTLNRLSLATQTLSSDPAHPNHYCWSYDAFGNRTNQVQSNQPFANGAGSNCQVADGAGMLSSMLVTYSSASNNRLDRTPYAPNGVDHDAAGNVTDDGLNEYLYDGDGRICAVANYRIPFMTIMTGYLYDAEGRRVSKGTITQWSCDPTVSGFTPTDDHILGLAGEQVTEMGVGGAGDGTSTSGLVWHHTNVWAAGKLLATYDGDSATTSGLHFYFDDPLGTRRVQTDYAGTVEQACSSLPFGDGETCAPTPTENLFTGKERDTESGLDYFGARYYASSMGRFSSPDPGWFFATRPDDPQSWNLYAYARNNPLSFVDPDGYDCVYLNNAGTDVDRDQNGNPTGIDQNSNSGECGNNGGYWVDGTVTQVNLYTNSNDVGLSGMWETGANAGQQTDSYYTNASSNGPGGVDLLSLPDSSFGEYRPLQNVLYSRQLDPWQAPSRLFGSHWCGPGGGGVPVSNLDAACKAHDQCFDAAGISAANNVGGGSMTLQQAAAAQGCNAALAAAAAANPNDPGSSRVSAWLKHGDQLLVITGGRIDGKLAAGTAVR